MGSPALTTKQRILGVAVESFLASGPKGVSMREIADRAGVTPMAIYRHFADKEKLLLAVLQNGFDVYADYLKPVRPATDTVEHLRFLAGRVFDFSLEQAAYFELMFLTSRTPEGLSDRSQMQGIHAPTYRVAREALRAAVNAGLVVVEDLACQTREMLAYCFGFCALFLSGGFRTDSATAKAQYLAGFDRHLGISSATGRI